VNHVQGSANVTTMQTVKAGQSIKTGSDGYVEILLRPGSFLRLGEDSEAMLDDTDLATVKVTILHGPALIEAAELNKDHPITVTTGNLTTMIRSSGLYKFENGIATVLQGKLQTTDLKLTYEKGWQVFYQDNYRARKPEILYRTSLESFSESRSGVIAGANISMLSTMGPAVFNDSDIWLYSPNVGLYTFIPRSDYRSPYGNRYFGHANRTGRNYYGFDNNSGTTASASNTSNRTSSDTANSSSGGGAAAPAPTASTPAGEVSTPAVYIESKNAPVGATTR